jgi:uncharacterized protein YcbK (DUF882 family)
MALLVAIMAVVSGGTQAQAETRSLKLYFIHTKERAEIVYKRNGRFDQDGINKINRFLRDWRRNESAKMDPRLLDLVWSVYRSVGARDYIHVVSAYRSPATNSMLRSRSSGVAETSQHMLGKAMDFYIPGVALSKLRAAAFKAEGGGVGYYPKSGSPFVHLDVGNVRSWPRMSRSELLALFPDGKTIHVPTDGKPLPGFNQALAAYEARKRSGGDIQVASFGNSGSGSGGASNRSVASFLSNVFRGGGADEEEDSSPAVAAAPAARVPEPAAAVASAREPARQTIIAALPERNAPLPGVAPRPLIDVGAPAKPLIEGLPSQEQAVALNETPAEALLAANVPVPSWRPADAPVADAPVQVAANDTLPSDVPLAAIAGERPTAGGSAAISDLLASTASEARADVIINGAPVPELRPRISGEVNEGRQVAATGAAGDVFALTSLPDVGIQPAAALPEKPDMRMASMEATPRDAVIRREPGLSAAAALQSGVRTTSKGAKPSAAQARPDPKSVVVPMEHQLTRWAFKRDVTVATAGGKKQPEKAYTLVWSSPETVYTSGFQQTTPKPADVSRFSGKAVTFMSVARFGTN